MCYFFFLILAVLVFLAKYMIETDLYVNIYFVTVRKFFFFEDR